MRTEYEAKLRVLSEHSWDHEVLWPQMERWAENFDGSVFDKDEEQLYGLFVLSRFMYFSKKLVREMLKSLYRDHFESPMIQRIRRNYRGTTDVSLLRKAYQTELSMTRFVGIGNPAESGAHLLYYFRQVNYLPKNLFADIASAFYPTTDKARKIIYQQRERGVARYIFFDDLVGSATQSSSYLLNELSRIRSIDPNIDLRFMSLFATTNGLGILNGTALFDGKAICLFELDDSYRAFEPSSRYFSNSPDWFKRDRLYQLTKGYGDRLNPAQPLGYKNGQLLLGFSHNTPDNTLPIFWDEGHRVPWYPVFARYDKNYG